LVGKVAGKAAKRLLALADHPSTIDDAIRIIASRLLDGVATPPTDLLAVADRLNVTQIGASKLFHDGQLLRGHDGEFAIEFADDTHEHRQRFTVAHELGHAVFAATGPGYPRKGKEVERLCDKIAVELLMPAGAFRQQISPPVTLPDVFRASRVFQTSLSATTVRCGELYKTLCFECSRTDVRWSRVPFVKRGPLVAGERALQELVTRAHGHGRFRAVLLLQQPGAFGWWHADSARLGNDRCLFLLRRATQKEIEQQLQSLIA
jgi:hypothetical protein